MSTNQESPEDIQPLQQQGENNDTINSTATNRNRNQHQPERVVGNPKDVLCGRGLHILNHHGNLQLHLLVNMRRQSYQQSRRNEKCKIIRTIIRETKRTGARFLKRVTGAGDDRWVEVDDKKAYAKVSHALRLQKTNESNGIYASPIDALSSANHQDAIATQTLQYQPSVPPVAATASLLAFPSLPAAVPPMSSLPGSGATASELILYDQLYRQMVLSMQSNPRLPLLPLAFYGLGMLPPNPAAATPDTVSSQSASAGDYTN
jgi:hypothetical protein